MTPRRLLFLLALACGSLLPARVLSAQTDVVRGRIIGPDSLPVERANVTVTSLSGNVSRNARTDKNGRFTVTFPGDEGDYMVTIGALGFASKRFEVKRTNDQEILVADARLQRVATELDAVKVNAQRQRVGRDNGLPDIGGSERVINSNAVSADQMGDLAALAASMPGVQMIPGADGAPNGFSVLGVGADQNSTTLNGMNFGGSSLPRDANVITSVITTPYDVSRGGFSGGQLSVRTRSGNNYVIRASSVNFDSPSMQWTDPAAQALGQRYQNVSVGGLFSGPFQPDKSFYSVSYQAGRRTQGIQSLLNTGPLGLRAAGIANDSVSRLLGILNRSHIPSTVGGIPGERLGDQAQLLGTFDFTPPSSTTGQAFNLMVNGSWSRQDPSGISPMELPSHSGERSNYFGMISGKHSGYFGFLLSETSFGYSQMGLNGNPFVDLPNGTVRVNSTFADAPQSVQTVSFGGNPGMNLSFGTKSGQLRNQLGWFSENNKHSLKLTTELRADRYSQNLTSNQLGTFSFLSLADLDADRPSSFTRQLSQSARTTGLNIASVALGDSYRPGDNLQLQYGLRADGTRFTSDPTLNQTVEQVFGARNDHVPNKIYLSPRFGFSYAYGEAPQIAAFQGAIRGPRANVRGGIGIIQGLPNTQTLGTALDNTGLPTGAQQLVCVGQAAPTPDWAAYAASEAAVPTRCADGTTGTVLSSTAPNVTLFDRNYAAPRALRSNLQWTGMSLDNRFATMVDFTYSLNMNQPSTYDLNFNPSSQFALANEGGRPVYARASSIVAQTGAIGAGEARVSPVFSHVGQLRSDMKSETKQLSVGLRPFNFSSNYSWSLSYVYMNAREQYRGFSSTSGDPLDVAWGRSSFDSRHQIVYSLTYNAFNMIQLGWYGTIRSGTPYTPIVLGDINGDGYSNDRAFIFDPSHTADTALASGMRSLLASGSGSARDCLARQIGRIAERNSCQGPWTQTANLSFSLLPLKLRLPQRANLTFQISNPLGAADALLHGDDHLHGWGQVFVPNSQLLSVRGFDPATNQFKYEVNQRFGATALSQSVIRAPVTLTALMRLDVGPARERQDLTLALDRGRSVGGAKIPEQMLRVLYGGGSILNPMAQILRNADTLELSATQADSIAVLNRTYTIKLDSIWTPVTKYLAELPDRYNRDEAYYRYRLARETTVDALIKLAPAIHGLLTRTQLRRLPYNVTQYLDTRYLASVRSGTQGTSLASMMMGGGPMAAMGGGGGGPTVIMMKTGNP
ncbi:MAG TPA: TonB-dependent receptor [Gemmatimonadaceae bacterium]|nr:TonB-dependent receptor [Gemmatimonadaceae bacterium]